MAKEKVVDSEAPQDLAGRLKQAKTFLLEVRDETKKVTWPDPKETVLSTAVIFLFTVIASLYLGAVDWFFTLLIGALVG
ncbi:MAG: preprotein translocase subunit SecE [Myxococcales bacterium]|nr:preprotein translocase subunit SecE [Myxococcales bacterium]